MKVEIHWPWGNVHVIASHTSDEDDATMLRDILTLSYPYDVIIDNGKVTFVEKE